MLFITDILEDLSIAHDFDNFERKPVQFHSSGKKLRINNLTDKARMECAFLGFNEVMSSTLVSKEDNLAILNGIESTRLFSDYKIKSVEDLIVNVTNPKVKETESMSTSLMIGILKFIYNINIMYNQ